MPLGELCFVRSLASRMPAEALAELALSSLAPHGGWDELGEPSTVHLKVTHRVNVHEDADPHVREFFRYAAARGRLCAWVVRPGADNDLLWEWCYRFGRSKNVALLEPLTDDAQREARRQLNSSFFAVPPGCMSWRALLRDAPADGEATAGAVGAGDGGAGAGVAEGALRGAELEERLVIAVALKEGVSAQRGPAIPLPARAARAPAPTRHPSRARPHIDTAVGCSVRAFDTVRRASANRRRSKTVLLR